MNNLFSFVIFFAFNICFSQTNNMLNLKFDEKYFLSNFITHKTDDEFVLRVFKITDSIAQRQTNKDYISLLDSVLRQEMQLTEDERKLLSLAQKKEHDSLSKEIENGNILKLFKSAVQVNFGKQFLENIFQNSEINNYEINQTFYNQFSINFSEKENLEKAKILFFTKQLSFHESIDAKELEIIQNCFMKENDILVKNNYLKKENDYLLIYKNDSELLETSYKKSKCFDFNKITYLLNNEEDYNIFSKLFFVKKSGNMENTLVNSIKGVDISIKENRNDYNDNYFYLSIYLDEIGKKNLSEFSERNIGKKVFTASNYEVVSNLNISKKIENGIFISGNLFKENWQKLYELVKFEVFRNSLTVQ